MKVKVSEAKGMALDWLVAKAEGHAHMLTKWMYGLYQEKDPYRPSTDWSQGGPIIERENISLAAISPIHETWCAMTWANASKQEDPTPLIAAMRCYVASKLGEEVDVPEVFA